MQPSKFVIGLVAMSAVMALLMLFMGELNAAYAPTDYNESQYQFFNKLDELHNMTNETRTDAQKLTDESGGLDMVGLVTDGLKAVKITFSSLDTFQTLAREGLVEASPLGDAGKILHSSLVTIVIVGVLVGGFLAAILKWWL